MCVPAVPLALIEGDAAREIKLRAKVKSLSLSVPPTRTLLLTVYQTHALTHRQSYCAMVIGHPSTGFIKGKERKGMKKRETRRETV